MPLSRSRATLVLWTVWTLQLVTLGGSVTQGNLQLVVAPRGSWPPCLQNLDLAPCHLSRALCCAVVYYSDPPTCPALPRRDSADRHSALRHPGAGDVQ